jgi:hypothetical protein
VSRRGSGSGDRHGASRHEDREVRSRDCHYPAIRTCAHSFCSRCLASYVSAEIQERIAEVRCPEEWCGGVLDPELYQETLPHEVLER